MPKVSVRCTVDNCYFWAEQNYCNAATILITSDKAAARYPENEAQATLLNDIGDTPAKTCMETACQTFKRK